MAVAGEDNIAKMFETDDNEGIPLDDDSYRLTLIKTSGYVLWDSQVTERLVNHIDRREVKAALEGREGNARRDSISTKMKLIYYALPVFGENGSVAGVFRLSSSVPGFSARISGVILPFVVFTIIMIIAVLAAVFAFSRSLSISMGRIVNITREGSKEPVAMEFRSLEKAIRAMNAELNIRLDQARSVGRRLEARLNGMSEAVFAMDSSLKLHLVIPCARKIFNLENENDMTLLEATHSAELTAFAKKTLVSDIALETEMTFRSSGTEQQFQVFAAPLSGVNGVNGRNGVVLVLQEITRLVKLERVRKDFVANVSHELRTPIQLIKGFSETLLDTVEDGKVQDNKKEIIHFLEIIRKNANTMENLTNDLLVLADLENNADSIRETEELNIASVIDEAISSVEPQAKRKKIEINVDCREDLTARLYGSFIIQALINLTDNAIKYSPEKSKVWVSADLEDDNIVFQVRDKGIGIPAEHRERIFERFYRVDKSRSKEQGGTGLGLSIVRHIALLHKGETEVESHAGEGSVFRIRIPVA
jgi:two-component system phosphate regulon sensor histidine kinase PhoR